MFQRQVFIDLYPPIGNKTYMVRAVKLEKANTGSYYNLSQGIMDTITVNYDVSVNDNDNNNINFQVYPNPIKDILNIKYEISKSSKVEVNIYDVMGREIQLIIDNGQLTMKKAGIQTLTLNARELKSEVYFVKLSTDSGTKVGKFIKE